MKTSDSPSERLACTRRPRAVNVPPGRAGRTRHSDSSEVAYGVAGGSADWTAQPSGPSARTARVPLVITPWGQSSQREAGILKVALPGPTSTGRMPVSRPIGGLGQRPAMIARNWSMPDWKKSPGVGKQPLTGSSQGSTQAWLVSSDNCSEGTADRVGLRVRGQSIQRHRMESCCVSRVRAECGHQEASGGANRG